MCILGTSVCSRRGFDVLTTVTSEAMFDMSLLSELP